MWRWIWGNIDLWLCLALAMVGYMVMHGPMQGSDSAIAATLAGSLIGGAAMLLGNWINRLNDQQRVRADQDRRRAKLKVLIAAELVDVTVGLIMATPLVEGALAIVRDGGHVAALDLHVCAPRNMPFTDGLGVELLALEQSALDALITLRSHLAITRAVMKDAIEGEDPDRIGLLRVSPIAGGIVHDMTLLAKAFQEIAPNRQLEFPNRPPELVTTILERASESLMLKLQQ